jgi:hypothetical protein
MATLELSELASVTIEGQAAQAAIRMPRLDQRVNRIDDPGQERDRAPAGRRRGDARRTQYAPNAASSPDDAGDVHASRRHSLSLSRQVKRVASMIRVWRASD